MEVGKLENLPLINGAREKWEIVDCNKEIVESIREFAKKVEWDLKEQTRKNFELISKLNEELDKKNRQIQKLVELLKKNNLNNRKVRSNRLQLVSEYLQDDGMTQDLYNLIKPYFIEYNYSDCIISDNSEQSFSRIIGYCAIENNKHYIVLPNGTKKEILNIPLTTYIGEGQFVLVDRDFNFRKVYNCKFEEFETDYLIKSFGLAVYREDTWYINKEDNSYSMEEINNIPRTIQLRHGQVISVGANNKFHRFYKGIRQSADTFMKSIKAKGHQLVVLLKVLNNGVYLRDVETGSEFVRDIDLNFGDVPVQEYQVLCLENGKIINIFGNFRFYTLSSYYNLATFGNVEIRDATVFLRKISGEMVIVNNIPSDIELITGQTIFIDEKNDFIGIKQENFSENLELVKKKPTAVKRTLKQVIPEIKKNILIIGNKQYEMSYKLTLLKYGYKTVIVEGYESWSRINSELRKSDLIVVIPSYVSHDNMWRIKKDVTDIPVIFSEYDGANRILECVLEKEEHAAENT